MSVLLEVIAVTVEDAVAAARGGANRLELVANLAVGGVTPSIETVRTVKRAVSVPVFVMIRPRGGDFVYSEAEVSEMVQQAREVANAGADGIVVGALSDDGRVDMETIRRVAKAADLPVTFHRAFDALPHFSMPAALRELAGLTVVERILTSGGYPNAFDGRHVLAELVREGHKAERSANHHGASISIMPGGGVTLNNAVQIVADTGVREIHVGTAVRRPSTADGIVDTELVRELKRRLELGST